MSSAQAVISQSTKDALVKSLMRRLEESLKTDTYASWTLQSLASAEEHTGPEFIILTISSYDLRMLFVLHASCTLPSMSYVANALKMPPNQLTTTRYYDFLGELGNRFCGSFKRDLSTCFPHIAMSTANRLHRESLKYLDNLSFSYDAHVNARTHDETNFTASLYVSFYGRREFILDKLPEIDESVESGVIEMF